MSPILKKQLTILCWATILVGVLLRSDGLRAQSEFNPAVNAITTGMSDEDEENEMANRAAEPRQKLTRDEAAKAFKTLLVSLGNRQGYYDTGRRGIISQKSEDALGSQSQDIILALAAQWKQPAQIVKVQSEDGKRATVLVEDDPTPPVRSFVVIEENGGWGIDLVETYAKWNNLEGNAKFQQIFNVFGVILDELPRDEKLNRSVCQSNLKKISLGLLQYIQDYDERYPIAKNWAEATQPYVKSEAIFNCPSLPKGQRYGYAYNSKLSHKEEYLLQNRSQTISIYETTVLKRNAYGMGEKRALRHAGGSNYAFADGHVKWFDSSKAPSLHIGRGIARRVNPPFYGVPSAQGPEP